MYAPRMRACTCVRLVSWGRGCKTDRSGASPHASDREEAASQALDDHAGGITQDRRQAQVTHAHGTTQTGRQAHCTYARHPICERRQAPCTHAHHLTRARRQAHCTFAHHLTRLRLRCQCAYTRCNAARAPSSRRSACGNASFKRRIRHRQMLQAFRARAAPLQLHGIGVMRDFAHAVNSCSTNMSGGHASSCNHNSCHYSCTHARRHVRVCVCVTDEGMSRATGSLRIPQVLVRTAGTQRSTLRVQRARHATEEVYAIHHCVRPCTHARGQ